MKEPIHQDIPDRVKKRLELFRLFYPLERKLERQWARIFQSDLKDILTHMQNLADENDYLQEYVGDRTILWRNLQNSRAECMFCFIEDITNLNDVHDMFLKLKKYHPILAYAIVPQTKDGDGIYDIFRFSRFSYLEHCNRVYSTKKKQKDQKDGA